MRFLKNIYEWVLSWSNHPSGPTALGIISFCEASFFPIPPDTLLIPLSLGKRKKALKFAFVCSICSIFGACLGYVIGKWLWWTGSESFSVFANFFFNHIPGFTNESFMNIKELYEKYNFMIVFTAGFTPIPFKLFTISAGAFKIQFIPFLFASAISRSARFYFVALLIRKYGDPIKSFIDQYFNLLAVAFTVLLFGGFALMKFVF